MSKSKLPQTIEPACMLPFTQLTLWHGGMVSPCCYRADYPLGTLEKDNWQQLWNGEKMQSLRREFLSGEIKTCAHDIKNRLCNQGRDQVVGTPEIAVVSRGPTKLDVRLNGQCNLECVMCEVWKMPNGYFDTIGFWDWAPRELFPRLAEIDVVGGEPFIQKDTMRLLDLIAEKSPECRWNFTTNAHWRFSGAIRKRLDRVRIKTMRISIDSLQPEVFARIRKLGQLKTALKTFQELVAYRDELASRERGFDIHLNCVIQASNAHEPRALLELARKHGVYMNFILLRSPMKLSTLALEKKKRVALIEEYEGLKQEFGDSTLAKLVNPLRESLDPARRLEQLSAAISKKAAWYVDP